MNLDDLAFNLILIAVFLEVCCVVLSVVIDKYILVFLCILRVTAQLRSLVNSGDFREKRGEGGKD